jgi:hypothetical protein
MKDNEMGGKRHLENLRIEGRIALKFILQIQDGRN